MCKWCLKSQKLPLRHSESLGISVKNCDWSSMQLMEKLRRVLNRDLMDITWREKGVQWMWDGGRSSCHPVLGQEYQSLFGAWKPVQDNWALKIHVNTNAHSQSASQSWGEHLASSRKWPAWPHPPDSANSCFLPEEWWKAEGALCRKRNTQHSHSKIETVIGLSGGPVALGLQWTSRNAMHSPERTLSIHKSRTQSSSCPRNLHSHQ